MSTCALKKVIGGYISHLLASMKSNRVTQNFVSVSLSNLELY